ncbi:MAG: hypothetical protein ABI721_00150 [Candidatus Dojkabacteria bacterium]
MSDHATAINIHTVDNIPRSRKMNAIQYSLLHLAYQKEFTLKDRFYEILQGNRSLDELSVLMEIFAFIFSSRAPESFYEFFKDRTTESSKSIYERAKSNAVLDLIDIREILNSLVKNGFPEFDGFNTFVQDQYSLLFESESSNL